LVAAAGPGEADDEAESGGRAGNVLKGGEACERWTRHCDDLPGGAVPGLGQVRFRTIQMIMVADEQATRRGAAGNLIGEDIGGT
jgi:hypothetical protein